jgi:hypothetical protein
VNITRKIFLETNSLFSLGPKLENVDLANLQELRKILGFEILVAETSWREYLRHRQRELSDCLTRNRQNRSMLEKHGETLELCDQSQQQIKQSLATLDQRYKEKAVAAGLAIVPLPSIDVHALLTMSLEGEPPFEISQNESGEKTKEKGFRDATIMFTMLDTIRGQDEVLIVTNDSQVKRGIEQRAKEYNTNPTIVSSIGEAVVAVSDELQMLFKERLKRETDKAIALLLRYRDDLLAAIGQVRELSASELGQSPLAFALGGDKAERLNIERVVSLDYEGVNSAVWKERDAPVSRILFKVDCRARVLASQGLTWPENSLFTVGDEKPHNSFFALMGTPQRFERDIPVELYGEAQFEKADDEWRLISIKVEKSFSKEYRELAYYR